jgi:hypothetical protein
MWTNGLIFCKNKLAVIRPCNAYLIVPFWGEHRLSEIKHSLLPLLHGGHEYEMAIFYPLSALAGLTTGNSGHYETVVKSFF